MSNSARKKTASTKASSTSGSKGHVEGIEDLAPGEFLESLEQQLVDTDRDLTQLSAEEQLGLLKSRSVHVVKEGLLLSRLQKAKKTGKPLRVKYGIDPTSPDAHLGHIVPIILARRLLQMGHHVIILFGDFTALVGDPTGRVKTRPMLTPEEVQQNVSSYTQQVGKFIDMSKVEVTYNSHFFRNFSILDLLSFYRMNKISPILQREDFRNRYEGLTIAEALYPTLMALDSVHLKADIELGGNDQLLNFHTAVAFMESADMVPQSSLTTELLQGLNGGGKKMSKSEGNFIALTEPAEEAFGKLMSIPDEILEHYFKLLTEISDKGWDQVADQMAQGKLNPFDVKKMLARLILTWLHSADVAKEEQQKFEKVFSNRALPDDIPVVFLPENSDISNVTELILHCDFAKSRGEVRRLVDGGGVRYKVDTDFEQIKDPFAELPAASEWILKVGKRKFVKLTRDESQAQSLEPELQEEEHRHEEEQRRDDFLAAVKPLSLVEYPSTVKGIQTSLFDHSLENGSLYYGTGLCTSEEMSVGLPFDVLGMVSVAEFIRRKLGLKKIIHLIADTHAKSNYFTNDEEVDAMADRVKTTMTHVAKKLGIQQVFQPMLSSEYDGKDEYKRILSGIETSDDHEYVQREWSDIEYLRRHHGLAMKLSWTIGSKVKRVGFDERLYDWRFSKVMKQPMSFLYISAGRTLDKDRPKASPYVSIAGENRILLEAEEDVASKLEAARPQFEDDELGGAATHLNNVADLFENVFGKLEPNLPLAQRLSAIIDHVCK